MCGSGSVSMSTSLRCSSVCCVMVSSSFRPGGIVPAGGLRLRLQIAINQVDLLLAAKALPDVLRSDLADSVDGLQLAIGGGEQLLQSPELVHDPLHHEFGQPGDAPQDAEPAWRYRVVEGVQFAVIAEQLGQPAKVEQVLVGQSDQVLDGQR